MNAWKTDRIATALTLAGSDPSGGAGLQADLKTFHQMGVYGMAIPTLLTVQNTHEVRKVHVLDPVLFHEQMQCLLSDIRPNAIKTGALGHAAMIAAVSEQLSKLRDIPLVVDPVMTSKHGASLMDEDALKLFMDRVLPLAHLVTPNIPEAERMTGRTIRSEADMDAAARRIASFGAKSVLIKGGHLESDAADLFWNGERSEMLRSVRIDTKHTHGTGCTFSAAITACIASGDGLEAALVKSKKFITEAIRTHPELGKGTGPVNHHAAVSET